MKPQPIDGWVMDAETHAPLVIYYRPGEEYWLRYAKAFREVTLKGLDKARSAHTSEVYRGRLDGLTDACYFKRYLHRDRMDPVKDLFRASRARRALENEQLCGSLGFNLPRSLCLVEEYHGGVLTYCVLVTKAIEDAPNIREWLTGPERGLQGDSTTRRRFLQAFARELGAWHREGLYHGDLRLSNVLARRGESGFEFFWLDNERNKQYHRLPERPRVNNLMRVNFEPIGVSATDRLRFWKGYQDMAGLSTEEANRILRLVVEKTYRRRKKRGWA